MGTWTKLVPLRKDRRLAERKLAHQNNQNNQNNQNILLECKKTRTNNLMFHRDPEADWNQMHKKDVLKSILVWIYIYV